MVNGEEIRRRREQLKLSQSAAAGQVGWSVQRWSDFECGRVLNPRITTLMDVAKVLGCKVDQLLAK